jgi:hypothetical protein
LRKEKKKNFESLTGKARRKIFPTNMTYFFYYLLPSILTKTAIRILKKRVRKRGVEKEGERGRK